MTLVDEVNEKINNALDSICQEQHSVFLYCDNNETCYSIYIFSNHLYEIIETEAQSTTFSKTVLTSFSEAKKQLNNIQTELLNKGYVQQ